MERRHVVSVIGIFGLGIVGSYMFPAFTLDIPWTIFLIALSLIGAVSVISFAGSARYQSPHVYCENVKFARLIAPNKAITDQRGLTWLAIPVRGWMYLKTAINSVSNQAVLIAPARLVEARTLIQMVVRGHALRLSPLMVKTLMEDRAFRQVLAEAGVDPNRPDGKQVWIVLWTHSVHPDSKHVRSPQDLQPWATRYSRDETSSASVGRRVDAMFNAELDRFDLVMGNPRNVRFVRKKVAESEQEDEER